MTHDPPDRRERDDLAGPPQRLVDRQRRAGIDQHRVVARLDQVRMALKRVIGTNGTDPPHAISDFERAARLSCSHLDTSFRPDWYEHLKRVVTNGAAIEPMVHFPPGTQAG